jgi:hypothetical protein
MAKRKAAQITKIAQAATVVAVVRRRRRVVVIRSLEAFDELWPREGKKERRRERGRSRGRRGAFAVNYSSNSNIVVEGNVYIRRRRPVSQSSEEGRIQPLSQSHFVLLGDGDDEGDVVVIAVGGVGGCRRHGHCPVSRVSTTIHTLPLPLLVPPLPPFPAPPNINLLCAE